MNRPDFLLFNRLLGSAVERGIPLDAAVRLAAPGISDPPGRAALEQVAADLREGLSLPEALARQPDLFPPGYLDVVKAGTTAGRLPDMLRRVDRHERGREALRRNLMWLGMYVGGGAVLCGLVFLALIPALRALLPLTQSVDLIGYGPPRIPWYTRVFLAVSDHWSVLMTTVIAAVLVLATVGRGFLRAFNRSGAVYLLPVWGPLRKARDLGLVTATLGFRLSAGTPLPDALAAAAEAVDNRRLRERLGDLKDLTAQGLPLTAAFEGDSFFPRALVVATASGERRGDPSETLHLFAELCAGETERRYQAVLALTTPIGILLLANGVVVLVWVAVLAPLAAVVESMGSMF